MFDGRGEWRTKVLRATSPAQTSVLCLFLLDHHDFCHSFRFPPDDESPVVSGGHAVREHSAACKYIYIWIGPILSLDGAHLFGFTAGSKPFHGQITTLSFSLFYVGKYAGNHHASSGADPRWSDHVDWETSPRTRIEACEKYIAGSWWWYLYLKWIIIRNFLY